MLLTVAFFAGETGEGILDVPAELGARELRVPKKQNTQVQRTPDPPPAGVVQVPAADSKQGTGEPAEPILRELPQRLVRT